MRTLVEHALANAAAATFLAVAAVLIGLVVRRPAVRHALWVIVLVRLLVPPVWTVAFPVPAADPAVAPVIASAVVTPIQEPAPTIDETEQPSEGISSSPAEPLSASPPAIEPDAPASDVALSAFTVAGVIWLAGSAFVFLRAARRIARFKRALLDAAPASSAVRKQAAELARSMGLRNCPDVLLVPGRVSPAVWMPAVFAGRAKLILPAELLAVLDADQRAAVLAHELAHLRRGDPWVRWLELLVGGLYWWFPLVGWFRRQLRAAEEECCDLRVVAALGRRRDYATALVETAAFLGDSGPVPALVSGAGPVKYLQRRVTMIMRATWPAGLTRLGLAAVLGLGGLGLAFGPAVAQDRGDEPKRERGRDDESKRDRPRDVAPRPGRADREAIEKARVELEQARKTAEAAMERLRAAQEALARAEGRPVPESRLDRATPPPADRAPTPERPRVSRTEPPAPPTAPTPPSLPGRRGTGGPAPELRQMQMQIEELRQALEQMRQELRRERGAGKEPPARDTRPGGERRDERSPGRE